MARQISTKQIAAEISTERRTWRTEIFSEYGTKYTVVFHREEIKKIDGSPSGVGLKVGSISFDVAENATREVSANGVVATVGQIAALVAKLADDLEEEKELLAEQQSETKPE
jgi:hypothetical protein